MKYVINICILYNLFVHSYWIMYNKLMNIHYRLHENLKYLSINCIFAIFHRSIRSYSSHTFVHTSCVKRRDKMQSTQDWTLSYTEVIFQFYSWKITNHKFIRITRIIFRKAVIRKNIGQIHKSFSIVINRNEKLLYCLQQK